MRVIVGTYRRRDYIERALRSIDSHLKGLSDLVFVDDSGDSQHADWLRQYGRVVETLTRGYGNAMSQVCDVADGRMAMFYEEDFELLQDVYLDEMAQILWDRPYLAQVALLRGPHFPVEHEHGGVIEALKAKGHEFREVQGILEHKSTFTGNPSVWRGSVFASGWPDCKWSEDAKRDQLLKQGYRFGYLPGIRVEHDGVRSGQGY